MIEQKRKVMGNTSQLPGVPAPGTHPLNAQAYHKLKRR
jgi:hypothetical protein